MTRYGEIGRPAQGGGSYRGAMGGGLSPFLCGLAAGAALMYFLDPDRGARRRSLLRDKVVGLSNDLGDAAGKTARDLRNRAQGVVAEVGGALGITGRENEQAGGQGAVQEGGQEEPRARSANA